METPQRPIVAFLLKTWPDPYCYPCMAGKLSLGEKEIREGAQLLALKLVFRTRQKTCTECGRVTEILEMAA